MAVYAVRFVVGLLWFISGLFLSPFLILGILVSILKRGPMGIPDLFRRKEHDKLPPVAKNPKFHHDYVRTTSGMKFHYVHSGSSSNPLMICLHGFPECWYSYHYILDHFSDKYHVVAVEMRGYGDSDKPKSIGQYHKDYLVNDVKEIVEALGYEKAIIVAHDWGGVIAWDVPHFFPEIVDKLIVCNAPHSKGLMDYAKNYPSQFLKNWSVSIFQIPFLAEFYIKMYDCKEIGNMFSGRKFGIRNPQRRLTDEETDIYKHCAGKEITYPLNYYRALNPIYTGMGLRIKTKKIHSPVLFIFGKDDSALDYRMVPFMKKYCDDVTTHLIEDCSHWVTLDRPKEVEKLMEDFLAAKRG